MCFRTICAVGLCLGVLSGTWAHVDGQGVGAFRGSSDDPAIKYSTAPLNNAVAEANTKIQDGAVRLTFEGRSGFLRSALEALQIPVDSQLLVFSRDSLQGRLINDRIPARCFSTIASRSAGYAAGRHRSRRSRRVRRRRVLHARTACRRGDRPAAVQTRIRVPGMSPGGRYARRARPADVQYDTPRSGLIYSVFRARRSQRPSGTALRWLVRYRQRWLSAAHGE